MRSQDLRYHPPGMRLQGDVCVVGAGPAGLVLAEELSGQGLEIVLVESGQVDGTADDGLNAVESIGSPRVADQRLVRMRTVGGASQIWYGRVAALDQEDLEVRPWVPHSGWPIDRADLDPFYVRAAEYFGVPVSDNTDPAALHELGLPRTAVAPELLVDYWWLLARHGRFGNRPLQFGERARALDLPGVLCVTNATVTQVLLDESGSMVQGVEVTAPDGRRRQVRASVTVLAAGGIENARLLLASNRRDPGGVGNGADQVGRYLMDHLRASVGTVDVSDPRAVHALSAGARRRRRGSIVSLRPGFALSPALQREAELLNGAGWVDWTASPDDPWHHLTRPANLKDPRHYGRVALRGAPLLLQGAVGGLLHGRMPQHAIQSATVECWIEQAPRSDSRVTLSSTKDSYGTPISRIDWRFGDAEVATARAVVKTMQTEFARLGLPRVEIEEQLLDGTLHLTDVAHPMGTTRMSARPGDGVVDPSCRVHGIENLYVVGGSVFPTGGHANPTHTVVALALRLADHLKTRGFDRRERASVEEVQPPSSAPEASAAADRGRPVALVTGASGKIGRGVVRRLLQDGWAVRALTSRSGHLPQDGVEWRMHDLRQDDLDFGADMRGIQAVVHLGAELLNVEDMWRTNVDATRALAEAAEEAGVKVFCYMSSISVYGSPRRRRVTEDDATLTSASDRPSEYIGTVGLRTYGRTKLAGEEAIRRQARAVRYVILRPSVVVEAEGLRDLAGASGLRRELATFRRTQHVWIEDVAAAVIWGVRHAENLGAPGDVETYNVADDLDTRPRFGQAFGGPLQAALLRLPLLLPVAVAVDIALLSVKHRSFGGRRFPLAHFSVSSERLRRAGFVPEVGMDRARADVLGASRPASTYSVSR